MVVYYGTGPVDFTGSNASFLGHFAEMDEFEPLSNIEELEAGLRKAGRLVSFIPIRELVIGFVNRIVRKLLILLPLPLAWKRTLSFLRETLH